MAKVRSPMLAYDVGSSSEAAPVHAKLFANGRSQAVRLPREFRMPGSEVLIRREGNRVILEPITEVARDANGWPVGIWDWLDGFATDFPDPEPLPARLLDPAAIAPLDDAEAQRRNLP